MKITEDVAESTQPNRSSRSDEALQAGMEQKSKEFAEAGSEIYSKVRVSSRPVLCYKIDMEIKLTAVFRKFPEGYAAFVEELPGANTQGATLEEAREN